VILATEPVRITGIPETRVAVLSHRGDPARIGDSVRAFIAWRREVGLPPSVSATYNILYGDPATTPPEDFRLDLCAGTDKDIGPNTACVAAGVIPGGRCAVLRHVGGEDGLKAALVHLCAEWLPQNGEVRRDAPPFLQRVRFGPDVPEGKAVTDIFLPLA